MDVNGLLKQQHTLRDQQTAQAKTAKQTAIQQIGAAANSYDRAVALWEEAIRATQMEGAGKENAQFRAWRDTEGELYKEKEVQSAVHLHLEWLVLTLQRSNGATVKELLPAIINYSKELIADQATIEALEDQIKKEKDQPGAPVKPRGPRGPGKDDPAKADEAIRKTHDSILRMNIANSLVVQWLKLGDFVAVEKWENSPANLDGIYKNIVQPELRTERDSRVFDYWDMKLKKGADAATKSKLSFEVDKFNTLRRPELLWGRAMEYTYLGQKNRAVVEMFNVIKTYPTHPDASDWVPALEAILAPPPPADAPATAPAVPVPAPAPSSTALPPAGPTPTASLPGAQ